VKTLADLDRLYNGLCWRHGKLVDRVARLEKQNAAQDQAILEIAAALREAGITLTVQLALPSAPDPIPAPPSADQPSTLPA
jgi:hypothetical protein